LSSAPQKLFYSAGAQPDSGERKPRPCHSTVSLPEITAFKKGEKESNSRLDARTHRFMLDQKLVNKKLFVFGSAISVALLILLWTVLRLTWVGQSPNPLGLLVGTVLAVLAFPLRLYVIFVMGENGSWPIPVLIAFLILTGLFWGFLVERATAIWKRS
jgi:hypothetical protein